LYSASLALERDGIIKMVGEPQSFTVKALDNSVEITDDRRALQDFQVKVAGLQRAVKGAVRSMSELDNRVAHVRATLPVTLESSEADLDAVGQLEARLAELEVTLGGDRTRSTRNEPSPLSIASRVSSIYGTVVFSQSRVGGNFKDSYAIAATEFEGALSELRSIAQDLSDLEAGLEEKGAPWTPGRIPTWSSAQ
jgi:capsule polysaccharide export protein KpsE/RkpR